MLPRPLPAGAAADRPPWGRCPAPSPPARPPIGRLWAGGGARQIQAAAGAVGGAVRLSPGGGGMETLTFPRYSPDDIVSYLRTHVLAGAEARNLVKGDVFGNAKVRHGARGRPRPAPGGRERRPGRSAGEGLCVPSPSLRAGRLRGWPLPRRSWVGRWVFPAWRSFFLRLERGLSEPRREGGAFVNGQAVWLSQFRGN